MKNRRCSQTKNRNNTRDKAGNNDTSEKLTGKIYIVGDSTVSSFNDNYYIPRYGYGTQLYNYFNTDAENIVNLALSGRSSLSFLTEENYATLISSITEGDYLIIGFGHNDEKSADANRFTNPTKTHTDASTEGGVSFQYILYEKYIKMASDKGATPILCTPIVRYSNTADYSGAKAHITAEGDYVQAIKSLGEATGTTVIDLTAITKAEYISLGAKAANYHAFATYTEAAGIKIPDDRDDTHINMYGAQMVCYEIATALKNTNCSLKKHVKDNIVKPTEESDFTAAINSSYEKSDYEAFSPANARGNKLATISGHDWYKTVLGDVGGATKLTTFSFAESNGTVTIENEGDNGRFAGTSDGFGAVFVQIDANKNFTASATVKVTKLSSGVSGQSAVGLMLRDDIHVDKYLKTLNSNFVAAGAIAKENTAIFSRSSASSLTKNSGNTTIVAINATFAVSLERLGQVVTATFADGANIYIQTFTDFDFRAVDNGYMYLCLFANRGITAEFSDVSFAITGKSQGA